MVKSNAHAITQELKWFQQLLMLRGKITFEQSASESEMARLVPPSLANQNSPYAQLIDKHQMDAQERLVLILALIPHIKPALLDMLHLKNELYDIPFTEFGGVRYDKHKGYLPTGETAVFLLAGADLEKRFALMPLFEKEHFFHQERILGLASSSSHEPQLYGLVRISQEYLSLLTTGKVSKPDVDPLFPAKRIETTQEWDDLVVSDVLLNGLEEIKNYTRYGKLLKSDYQFGKKIKPGFRVLFTGPPGTGKTLTATLLGKSCRMDVYHFDLSMVSTYIGETEKNISRIFDRAEKEDWILFFDGADDLFGKRTAIKDARDGSTDQAMSFILRCMDDFDGLIIVRSNSKKNVKEAFFRRFQLVLDFEIPHADQRYDIWQKSKTPEFEYEEAINLKFLAKHYELTPASINNVLHYSMLKCMGRGDNVIKLSDIEAGLKIEQRKEGKNIVKVPKRV